MGIAELLKLANKFKETDKANVTLGHKTRAEANDRLIDIGMDGNGRFKSVGRAISDAFRVLEDFNIEPDQVFTAWEFNKPKGTKSIELAFSNPADPFAPMPITNSNLFFSWFELMPDKFEVVAYLS